MTGHFSVRCASSPPCSRLATTNLKDCFGICQNGRDAPYDTVVLGDAWNAPKPQIIRCNRESRWDDRETLASVALAAASFGSAKLGSRIFVRCRNSVTGRNRRSARSSGQLCNVMTSMARPSFSRAQARQISGALLIRSSRFSSTTVRSSLVRNGRVSTVHRVVAFIPSPPQKSSSQVVAIRARFLARKIGFRFDSSGRSEFSSAPAPFTSIALPRIIRDKRPRIEISPTESHHF